MPRPSRKLSSAVAIGPRVFLRKPSARDAEEFVAAVKRSRRLHRSWITAPREVDQYLTYLKRKRRPENACFIVCRRDDRALIGVINVNQIVRGYFDSAYLGYFGFRPFDGQGYMTEGLQLLLKHAFGKMKLHRLEANIQPENARSIALAKRCGFRLEGLSRNYLKIAGKWCDHQRWAITVEDWKPK